MLIDKLINKDLILTDDVLFDTDPKLRKLSDPIQFPIDSKLIDLGKKMLEHVKASLDEELSERYKLRGAVGIAAPQLGVLKAMVALHVDDETLISMVLVNPKIIAHSERLCALKNGEACLSVVEGSHEGIVHRYHKIKVKAYNLLEEKEMIIEFKGYQSIVVQHELDHLKGVLYYDHIDKNDPWKVIDKTIIY